MKQGYFFIALLLFVLSYASAQNTIFMNPAVAPQIDGHFSSGEWSNAGTVLIELSPNITTTVWYMRDQNNFYFAFTDNLESQNVRFPEILLDVNHDEAGSFQADDWWFHVSATDCEYQGQYANYDSCALIRPNWLAEPNFSLGNTVDTVEIQIPLATLAYSPQSGDTIGIAFLTTNTFSNWSYWPAGIDHLDPSTWGDMVISPGIRLQEVKNEKDMSVFPNPSDGRLQLHHHFPENAELYLSISDLGGKILFKKHVISQGEKLELDTKLGSGSYILQLTHGQKVYAKNIVIR